MPKLPSKDEIQEILRPYHRRIRSVVERAWAEWRQVEAFRSESKLDPLLYSRTVANYVFDAIARIAVAEFAADVAVHIKIEPQTIKLFFKGGVYARFKKGDDNKLGQNNPTQASMAFEDADEMLPGFPPETAKVEFIWIANDIQTRLEHVLVVARDNDRLLWDYPLDPGAATAAATGVVVAFPSPVSDQAPADNESLVKPRAPADNKAKEEE